MKKMSCSRGVCEPSMADYAPGNLCSSSYIVSLLFIFSMRLDFNRLHRLVSSSRLLAV